MPERLTLIRTIASNEVQGEESWVKVKPFLLGEVRERLEGDSFRLTYDEVLARLLEWNWVDGEGNPIQIPATGQELQDMLTPEEASFLTRVLIRGRSNSETKN